MWKTIYLLTPMILIAFHCVLIPVEMGDPFTKMCQNFFSFLSHTQQRGYVIATTQALSFSFSLPSPLQWCVYAALSFLSFPITHRSFPIYPHLCYPHNIRWSTLFVGGTVDDSGHNILRIDRSTTIFFLFSFPWPCRLAAIKKWLLLRWNEIP